MKSSCQRFQPLVCRCLIAVGTFLILTSTATGAHASTRTWDGGGANASWSTAANWVDDIAPVAGDDLVFPANAAVQTASNNYGFFTTFNSITFSGGTYTVGGNPLTLTSGMTVSAGTHIVNFIIRLGAPQTFTTDLGATLTITIAIVNNGNLCTVAGGGTTIILGLVTGSGGLTKEGTGIALLFSNNSYTGATTVNGGVLIVDGSQQNSAVTVSSAALGGTGTTGAVTATTGIISAGTLTSPTGILNIHGNLSLDATSAIVPKLNGNTVGTGYDQLNVTGVVDLSQSALLPAIIPPFVPNVGDVFTLINNDGTDGILGNFAGLPEGANITTMDGVNFRLSYVGGTGNDVTISVTTARRARFDFDGDGKTDVGVFRPATGVWYLLRSSDSGFVAQQFGLGADRIVPGDYDGDGKADIAVWRPSNGFWYLLNSSDNSFRATAFGQAGDVPISADYDGDGKDDLTVYRGSAGTFYQLLSSDNSFHFQQWGANGDISVAGDYDGDGKADLAIFRPSISTFYILQSSNNNVVASQFGQNGDKPIACDFDGDEKTDIGVFRPTSGVWYYLQSSDNSFRGVGWGTSEDIPVAGDYDGDGKWDEAVFRPSTGTFYILLSSNSTLKAEQFGANGDIGIASAYVP